MLTSWNLRTCFCGKKSCDILSSLEINQVVDAVLITRQNTTKSHQKFHPSQWGKKRKTWHSSAQKRQWMDARWKRWRRLIARTRCVATPREESYSRGIVDVFIHVRDHFHWENRFFERCVKKSARLSFASVLKRQFPFENVTSKFRQKSSVRLSLFGRFQRTQIKTNSKEIAQNGSIHLTFWTSSSYILHYFLLACLQPWGQLI